MSPQRRVSLARLRAILRSQHALEDEAVREQLRLLTDMRRSALRALGEASGFRSFNLSQVIAAIDRAIDGNRAIAQQLASRTTTRAYRLGTEFVDGALLSIGAAATGLAGISPELLSALLDVTNDQLRGVWSELGTNLKSAVRRTVLGITDPDKAMGEVARMLRAARPFANAEAAAERIVRTEVNRTFAMASQARLEQSNARLGGGLRKWWLTADDDRVRPSHEAAGKRYGPDNSIPAGERFLVGDAKLMQPLDPSGPPEETINCFPSETSVLTTDGPVPIEAIRSGDFVLTHENRWRPVIERHVNEAGATLLEILLQDGCAFRITPGHKLFVVGRGWIEAGTLQGGDQLLDPSALASIHETVGHVEHPHPELAHVVVAERVEAALPAVDLYGGPEFRQEEIEEIHRAPLVRCAACVSAASTLGGNHDGRINPMLCDDLDADRLQPVAHDDLSRAGLRTVLVTADLTDEVRIGGDACSLSAPPLVGPGPLLTHGVAAVRDVDAMETEHLRQSAGVSAEGGHDLAVGRAVDLVTAPQPRDGRFSEKTVPLRHMEDGLLLGGAAPGAAAPSLVRLSEKGPATTGALHRNGHETLYHGPVVAEVRSVPGLHAVFNLGVAEDMSYFAAGVLGRNCRCRSVPDVSALDAAVLDVAS